MRPVSTLPLRLAVRSDGDEIIGFGHVKRSLTFSDWVSSRTHCGFFLKHAVTGTEKLLKNVDRRVYRCQETPSETVAEIVKTRAEWVLFDVSHDYTRASFAELIEELSLLRDAGIRVVLIDGVGDDAILGDDYQMHVDILVRPYVGLTRTSSLHFLAGPDFFILSPNAIVNHNRPRSVRKNANRILVTTGGSDKYAIGPYVLRQLNKIRSINLDVTLIVGPNVLHDTDLECRKIALSSHHSVQVVGPLEDIMENMLWSDVTIATTGLTKYELAFTGTPSIQISPDYLHDDLNRKFSAQGCAIDCGVFSSLSENQIVNHVEALLRDFVTRQKMSDVGVTLIDGMGAQRILKAMRELDENA